MKMKRTCALLLAVVLLLSVLSGCGNSLPKETEAGEAAESVVITGHGDSDADVSTELVQKQYDLTPRPLCEEKTTLRVLTYDGVNATYPAPSNDQWFWKTLEDYTNVHVEWDIAPYSGYSEVTNTRLSAGVNLPDVIMMNGTRACKNAGDNGILIDLMPYWDSCFTNTRAYFDSIGVDLLTYAKNPNGTMYALPNTANPTEGHITFLYNTAWMEELGAKVPETLDEFTDLLYKMQAAGDLNHNGIDDEIVLTSSGMNTLTSVLGNAFNLEQYEGWDAYDADENGRVFAEYTTDNMRAYLKYLRQLYQDGILDSEILTTGADSMGEKIASDRVGCFVYFSGFALGYGQLTSRGVADPMAECYTLGLPLASEWNGNEGYFVRRTVAYGCTGGAITYECTNRELAARWLDVLYADPNILFIRCYGKEGETFRFNEAGEVELITESGEWDQRYLGCGQISLPLIQTAEELLSDKLVHPWYLEEYEQLRQCKWVSASVPKVSVFTEEEEELRDDVFSDVDNYWYEWRDKFISGIMDIDTDWDTYVNSINNIGLKQLVQVWQMVYDRTKES